MKIADVHAHVFLEKLAVKAAGSIGQFYGTKMYCEASMERLVAEEEKAGVSRYVISSSAVVPKQVRSIVEFLAEARGRASGVHFLRLHLSWHGRI